MAEKIKKILIIEDDTDLRQVLADRLSSYTFHVLQAEDGQTGYEMVVKEKPDLVLLDLLLPKMDGFKVLDSIRHNESKEIELTKVIVLSNLWSNKDILRVKALQVDEYYVKANTNLEEIFDKVKKVLG